MQGLRFIIQSEKTPAILDERIEAFLVSAKVNYIALVVDAFLTDCLFYNY